MATYTNSPLATYKNISPHKTKNRTHAIDTITIHCWVGQVTAKVGCDYFANTDRGVSSNYVVGKDGSIGLSVDEKDRAWTSGGYDNNGQPIRVNGISGADNDHRAVTIEVASDTVHPYAITDAAYKSLVELCADICKRNGIKKLLWKGDKSLVGKVEQQNMTVHRWFAYKSCPGDYIYSRLGKIADEVNKKLGTTSNATNTTTSTTLYYVRKTWTDAKTQKGAFKVLANAKACADKNAGYKVFDNKGNIVYSPASAFKSYLVKVTANMLNIRKGPGTNYAVAGTIKDKSVYTIVAESTGKGATKWGKLKSGAGWISLDYTKKV